MNGSDEQIAFSIDEAMRATSLGRTLIYELINEGHLEVTRIGRRTLIKAESLRRLIDKGLATKR